jgi:hypothetical protein
LSTETGRIELSFTSDPRLLAGVAGAVNHVAEAVGLAENSRAELVAAVEDACQEALNQVAKEKGQVALSVEVVGDKIEAVVEYKPMGGGSASAAGGAKDARLKLDSVRRETKGDQARIILTKKIPHQNNF